MCSEDKLETETSKMVIYWVYTLDLSVDQTNVYLIYRSSQSSRDIEKL